MKRLFVLTTIIASTMIATSAYSQIYVNAHVRLPFPPVPHIGLSVPVPAPVVVQQAPICQEEYAPAPVAYDYPDAAYYTYPAWNGHYRDRIYYEHYRPCYEREHRVVYEGRGYDRRGYDHRGYDRRDYDHRGYDRRGEYRRGW